MAYINKLERIRLLAIVVLLLFASPLAISGDVSDKVKKVPLYTCALNLDAVDKNKNLTDESYWRSLGVSDLQVVQNSSKLIPCARAQTKLQVLACQTIYFKNRIPIHSHWIDGFVNQAVKFKFSCFTDLEF